MVQEVAAGKITAALGRSLPSSTPERFFATLGECMRCKSHRGRHRSSPAVLRQDSAFSPGGLEAMTILAFALGLDPLYVGAQHLARYMLISLTLPLTLRFWLARAGKIVA